VVGVYGIQRSNLTIAIVYPVESCGQPFLRRSAEWDVTELPVPADVLVYTEEEWQSLIGERFHQKVMQEAVWIYRVRPSNSGEGRELCCHIKPCINTLMTAFSGVVKADTVIANAVISSTYTTGAGK
jgi:hypothetical protein